jgi:hypothetical protein
MNHPYCFVVETDDANLSQQMRQLHGVYAMRGDR